MAHPQIARELRTPQVIIAVRHAQILVVNLGIDREREGVGAIQNSQSVRNYLNVAGSKFRILRSGHAGRDFTRDLDHVFTVQTMRLLRDLGVFLRAKHDLR